MTTAREKFHYTRTLCCLLKALEGVQTEIELRNESHVKGTVELVSGSMGVTMRNCELIVAGRARKLQRLFVQGRKIRMVVIPDEIDMIDAMQGIIDMYNAPTKGRDEFKRQSRGRSRGRGRGRGSGTFDRGKMWEGRARGGLARGRAPQGANVTVGDENISTGRGRGTYRRGRSFGDKISRSRGGIVPSQTQSGGATESSMLHPAYIFHATAGVQAEPCSSAGASGITSQRQNERLHHAEVCPPVQSPTLSSTTSSVSKESSLSKTDLRRKIFGKTDFKQEGKSHTKTESFSGHRHASSSRKDETCPVSDHQRPAGNGDSRRDREHSRHSFESVVQHTDKRHNSPGQDICRHSPPQHSHVHRHQSSKHSSTDRHSKHYDDRDEHRKLESTSRRKKSPYSDRSGSRSHRRNSSDREEYSSRRDQPRSSRRSPERHESKPSSSSTRRRKSPSGNNNKSDRRKSPARDSSRSRKSSSSREKYK